MQNRTAAIVITVVTSLACLCSSIICCSSGIPIASGNPITYTLNGQETQQTYPATVGYALLCGAVLLLLVPVVVGFFTLRKKPEAVGMPNINEPRPPAS